MGSGGWKNITEKFRKAKSYCDVPFEVLHKGSQKAIVPIKGEWIGDRLDGKTARQRIVDIRCGDAAAAEFPESSLDAVFTDPPYYGNVQYAELMDFCYVWLRRLIGNNSDPFRNTSTRNPRELTGNIDMGRGLRHFTEGLASVFQKMAKALKPGAPLAFTYHHNTIEAYLPVAVAILDAGVTCSASLPCPAEMGASIHINGTGSSIIDTVFVCRTTGVVSRKALPCSPEGVASLVRDDLAELRRGNVNPSFGDTRCIAYGHLVRLAIWNLRSAWDRTADTAKKMAAISTWLRDFGGWPRSKDISINPSLTDSPNFCSKLAKKGWNTETKMEMFPFEATFGDILKDPDTYVDAVFSCLESEFLYMPKGAGFVEYSVFERGYEALKTATRAFSRFEPAAVLSVIHLEPIAMVVLRYMLGFTPPEWGYVTTQRTGVVVSQGFVRSIDRKVRMTPETPIHITGVTKERLTALVETACQMLTEGAPQVGTAQLHRSTRLTRDGELKAFRIWPAWAFLTPCCFTNVFSVGHSPAIGIR